MPGFYPESTNRPTTFGNSWATKRPGQPTWPSATSGGLRLATALGTASYTAADVGWLLSDTTAPDLLTRLEVADGLTNAVTYRLFHEALAEYLRTVIASRMSFDAASRSFAAVLVNAVPTRPDGPGRQWTRADQYTRTYVSVHAAAGGVFDDLACDLSFITLAEPSRLLQALPAVNSAEGRRVAEVITRVGRHFLLFPVCERLSYLELAARKSGDPQLADRISDFAPDRPWSVPWACWATPASGRTIGHHGLYINGLSLMSLNGRPIVATADRTAIRLWDPQTASAVGELTEPELAEIWSMTTTSTDTGPRVVTGHADGPRRSTSPGRRSTGHLRATSRLLAFSEHPWLCRPDSAKLGALVHQLCCQHYPDPRIMPTSDRSVLVGGGARAGVLGIITALRGTREAGRVAGSGWGRWSAGWSGSALAL